MTDEDYALVDIHMAGGGHHRIRAIEAETQGLMIAARWHRVRHLAHLAHLMRLVHEHGDFSNATDDSLNFLDCRDRWNPEENSYVHPEMFDSFLYADYRWPLMDKTQWDAFLTDMRPPYQGPRHEDAGYRKIGLAGHG
jgi:hypothetical protein